MQIQQIIIQNGDEFPLETVPRALGKVNSGMYCAECSEFISFAAEERAEAAKKAIEFVCETAIKVKCPFCKDVSLRHVSEIRRMVIVEANKRRR